MRRILSTLCFLLLLAACGGESAEPEPTTTTTTPTTSTTVPEPEPEPEEIREVWAGFAATAVTPSVLTALVHEELDIFDSPDDGEPRMTVEPQTILGTTTVLGVVSGPRDGWVELMLPVRPNGSTGWARSDDLSFYIADSEIVVDLSERRLSYVVDGVEVLTTEVGIGSDYNETPTGHYFVTDSVTLADANSAWGPHALGISARSDTITEFNGGDGIIGIHGTNNPSSIGGNISLGCVRLPNDMITALHKLVPIGTRVEVTA